MARAEATTITPRGLVFHGQVTSVIGNTSFTSAGIAGLGDNFLRNWLVYVVRKSTGIGTAPQGEAQPCSAYVSSTGQVTHIAFTSPLAIGDDIYALHPSLAGIGPGAVGQAGMYYGVVTAVPGANQFTIPTLAGLGAGKFAGLNPFYAFVFRDAGGVSGAPQGEYQAITAYDPTTGTFTTGAFTAAVAIGDEMLIIHPFVVGSVSETTVAGTSSQNWQAAEQTLVTVGANGVSKKVWLLIVGIQNTVGNITIRLYHRVNGVERQIFPTPLATTFNVAVDPPGVPVINAAFAITEALRVTVQSNAVADNGMAVTYEYKTEAM